MIIIIDFGSQTTHLIGRRLRDIGVKSKIILPEEALNLIKFYKPKGIILSDGLLSVYGKKLFLFIKKFLIWLFRFWGFVMVWRLWVIFWAQRLLPVGKKNTKRLYLI
mgnify:CR=1 FL=1